MIERDGLSRGPPLKPPSGNRTLAEHEHSLLQSKHALTAGSLGIQLRSVRLSQIKNELASMRPLSNDSEVWWKKHHIVQQGRHLDNFEARRPGRGRPGKGAIVSYVAELQDVIRRLHEAEPTHAESVPVHEKFHGKTIWDGVVEVFDLVGHPKATRVYAWANETDDANRPRHVTVLHLHPVNSPQTAVRAAIIQEIRNLGPIEEG
jgi:hypothetical protein